MFFDFQLNGFQVESHLLEDIDGDSLVQLDQTQKQVLRAHIVVVETVCLFSRQSQDLLGSGSKVVESVFTHSSFLPMLRKYRVVQSFTESFLRKHHPAHPARVDHNR